MVFILEIIYLKNKKWSICINLDEYEHVGTHWIAMYVKNNEITYFDSFGVDHVLKEIKRFIEHKKHQNKHI